MPEERKECETAWPTPWLWVLIKGHNKKREVGSRGWWIEKAKQDLSFEDERSLLPSKAIAIRAVTAVRTRAAATTLRHIAMISRGSFRQNSFSLLRCPYFFKSSLARTPTDADRNRESVGVGLIPTAEVDIHLLL